MSNTSTVVQTNLTDSNEAGTFLGSRIRSGLAGASVDALIVFASARYDYHALLTSIEAACRPKFLVGCSSAGEFATGSRGEGAACAIGLHAPSIRFSAALTRGVGKERGKAAAHLVAGFEGMRSTAPGFRNALVLTDALAGHADDLVEELTVLTGGRYQFFGGGAGDDGLFQRTHVFLGTEAVSDAAVALEMVSDKPIGIGVRHGWMPASAPMRVTESEGARVISLNSIKAVEVYQAHAKSIGARFDPKDPMPFFLHSILGIDTGDGHRLRVPLGVNDDGSISYAAEVPQGATVHIMKTTGASAAEAGEHAARVALEKLNGAPPAVALLFDCVATRLRLGDAFGDELAAVEKALGGASFAGCNTYGQIARADGQFGGFHNCTAVVCVIPR